MLVYNAFQFGEEWYIQQVDIAMGMPVTPTFANLFLAYWEKHCIYTINSLFVRYIEYWSCFIDNFCVCIIFLLIYVMLPICCIIGMLGDAKIGSLSSGIEKASENEKWPLADARVSLPMVLPTMKQE